MSVAKPKAKPTLPVQQLVILSICRFSEPVALQSVFPYLPEMIESFGIDAVDIGYWVGIVAACFSLTQALTGVIWGMASDHYGRKPAILLGLCCTMVASLIFGFSDTLPQAIVARSLAGAASGTVGIIRTTVAEMVPHKELQPRAFSVMPLIWSVGSVIGPMIGGALARPAESYPDVFGNSALLKRYPFALPNMVSSALFIIGLTSGVLFLKETLESRKNKRDCGLVLGEAITKPCSKRRKTPKWLADEQASTLTKTKSPRAIAPPRWREIFSPQSNLCLLSYCVLALHSVAFDQLIPVFLHAKLADPSSPRHLPFQFTGGFGINHIRIGIIFTIYSIVSLIMQFTLFPPLARRFGVLRCFRICTACFPVAYFLAPFTVLLPTSATRQLGIIVCMVIKAFGVIFAFPCSIILLTNSASSLRLLGTLNGVSTSLSAVARAIGPVLAGGLATVGDDIGYIILPFCALSLIGAIGHISTYWLVEKDGFGDSDPHSQNADAKDDTEITPLAGSNPDAGEQAVCAGVSLEDEAAVEADDENEETPLLARKRSGERRGDRGYNAAARERISNPIGMKEPVGPGGRRLSNGLAQSNNGLGKGGDAFQ